MYRSKFIFGLPEIDIEIIKHLNLNTLYDWIIDSTYIEKITAVALSNILPKFSEYDDEIGQYLPLSIIYPLTDYNILEFTGKLFRSKKYKLVKIIIDYFDIDNIPYDDPEGSDFYLWLFYHTEHYLRNNDLFQIYFKLAPKNVKWSYLNNYLESIFSGYVITYAITLLTMIFNVAKKLNIYEIIKMIKIISKSRISLENEKDNIKMINEFIETL